MAANEGAGKPRALRRDLSQSSVGGQVTPGLDDGPFIQYALDALTREDGMLLSESLPSRRSSNNAHVSAVPRTAPSQPPPEHQPTPAAMSYNPLALAAYKAGTPSSSSDEENYIPVPRAQPGVFGPTKRVAVPYQHVEYSQGTKPGRKHGAPNHKPTILRPMSFMLLMTLCILMIVALIVSAVYSKQHTGLLLYPGSINTGHYFLFRILPQILGAIIFLYAQAMILTTTRILPFERMNNEDPQERHGAIFLDLYPRSFLWPHFAGPAPVKIYAFAAWLMNFSLPLLSALFGMLYVEGEWIWATVQGVAWALVAMYLMYLAGLGTLGWFWFRRDTGMLWDIRSIADMVPMLHHSNVTTSYKGTGVLATRRELEEKLQDRMNDRLGYWQLGRAGTEQAGTQAGAYWFGIGTPDEEAHPDRAVPCDAKREPYWGASGLEKEVRYRYLPWGLRTPQMLAFFAAGVAVLVILLVVSFIPSTRLSRGFMPEVQARPNRDGFSAANFLYSFVPSLLGQILFLLFQSLEMSYKELKPWSELSRPEGETARRSILLDYAACYPLQAIYRAVKRRHYRLAAVSTLATLFVFLPILGGGLFTALTISGTRNVRTFPSMPVYGVVLALLGLYVAALGLMLPNRGRYRLPHAVRCLAEIFSFVANDEIAGSDPAFRFPRDKTDMMGRLGAGRNDESRWWFGVAAGREEVMGVRRVRKYTERRGV